VTQPWSPDYKRCDIAAEIRQGRNIVDACLEAGVEHLVLSTLLLLGNDDTGVPHIDSKRVIESYARQKNAPVTFVRPGSFMDNIGLPFFPVKRGRVRGFVAADAKVPYVACSDVGGLVCLAFARGRESVREIDAVSDFRSGLELAAMLGRLHGGAAFKYSVPPALLVRLFAREFYAMRRLFERCGRPPYPPEIDRFKQQTRQLWPQAMTLEQFLQQRGYGSRLRAD
jgi:hypothetical protein